VIVSAGVLGTLELLFRCRDVTKSLPGISSMLGERVRTNSEALLGVTTRHSRDDHSQGIAISSVFHADNVTRIEPVRFSKGSSFIRTLSAPLIHADGNVPLRILKTLTEIFLHPVDFLHMKVIPRWAERTTIFLVMQTEDNLVRMRLGRNIFTFGRKGVEIDHDVDRHIPTEIKIGSDVARMVASRTDAVAAAAFTDSLFNFPSTAHVLGGVPMGRGADDGVVNVTCEVFSYPGLFVIDGSIMPANPGINPSLTITALAEYAMSHIPPKKGVVPRLMLVANPLKSPALDQ
jgi:cholesterol oxidase